MIKIVGDVAIILDLILEKMKIYFSVVMRQVTEKLFDITKHFVTPD